MVFRNLEHLHFAIRGEQQVSKYYFKGQKQQTSAEASHSYAKLHEELICSVGILEDEGTRERSVRWPLAGLESGSLSAERAIRVF